MTAEPDLLPCPFCGAAEPIIAEHPNLLPPSFRVICSDGVCHAMVEARTLVRARLMWNRRATAAKDAEIEALRAEVAERVEGFADRAEQLEARAERLAEALRECGEFLMDMHILPPAETVAASVPLKIKVDAALEQEAGR